jgi:hypothetical protein
LELPEALYTVVNYPTRFDCLETLGALQGSGVTCPKLNDYAWRLWDYGERQLDPELRIDRSLRGSVAGKVVLVIGGSSGIGLAAAHIFAEAGATTLICDRFVRQLGQEHGAVEFLISNAGRSIRRGIESSYERFHDLERTMQLNYFGSLRVTLVHQHTAGAHPHDRAHPAVQHRAHAGPR